MSAALSLMAINLISFKCRSDLYVPEPRRCSPVSRAHHLLRLTFATVRRAPESPLVTRTDSVKRIPKFRRDPRVRWILQHADTLAVLDLPTHLAAELKVVASIINRPRAVGLHQNAMVSRSNQLLKSEWLFSGRQADVSHADHGQPVPSFGAQSSSRTFGVDGVRGFTRPEITGETPVRDDRRTLRRDPFVIKGKSTKPRTMLLAGIGNHID